jgi:hypothetical protein
VNDELENSLKQTVKLLNFFQRAERSKRYEGEPVNRSQMEVKQL